MVAATTPIFVGVPCNSKAISRAMGAARSCLHNRNETPWLRGAESLMAGSFVPAAYQTLEGRRLWVITQKPLRFSCVNEAMMRRVQQRVRVRDIATPASKKTASRRRPGRAEVLTQARGPIPCGDSASVTAGKCSHARQHSAPRRLANRASTALRSSSFL